MSKTKNKQDRKNNLFCLQMESDRNRFALLTVEKITKRGFPHLHAVPVNETLATKFDLQRDAEYHSKGLYNGYSWRVAPTK